jgi:hypothetical protein
MDMRLVPVNQQVAVALGAGQQILHPINEGLPLFRIRTTEQLLGLFPGQVETVQGGADRLATTAQAEALAHPAASPSRGGASFVAPSARTMFARLMIPTTLPSRMTGTRLIRFAPSNSATSASSVSSVTVTTSGVMASLTVRPCDLTYSRAFARSEAEWSSHHERQPRRSNRHDDRGAPPARAAATPTPRKRSRHISCRSAACGPGVMIAARAPRRRAGKFG